MQNNRQCRNVHDISDCANYIFYLLIPNFSVVMFSNSYTTVSMYGTRC